MGGSSWSDDHYNLRASSLRSSGKTAFAYTDDIKTGKIAATIHKDLDPKNVIRESRDSAAHPESNAVMVLMDTTGSMGKIPILLQQKLPKLLGLLLRKGYLTDPQICFGAVGDAYSDRAPFQIFQFESGNEMDDGLSKIYIEGGGGGTKQESYELGMYFAAFKTQIDCLEKRGKKGYLFLIGDEAPYDSIPSSVLSSVFGEAAQEISTSEIVRVLNEKYETFILIPTGASNSGNSYIKKKWTDLFGQNVVEIKNNDEIAEAIAGLIGMCEGYDVNSVVSDTGASAALSKELTTVGSKSRALKTNVSGGLIVSSVEGI